MQIGIIGAILAVILAGGVFLFGGNANESAKVEMEKQAMEEKSMTEDAVVKSDEDADEMEKNMMEKDGSTKMGDSMMKKDDSMMQKDETEVKEDTIRKDGAMMEKDAMMMKGSIQGYSPEKLALAEKEKVLLFFHASWCPICRGLDAEAAANPNVVPDGITVLKVDFDTATALRQKYGVTVQHTFVQVDAAGNSLKKFSDASTYGAVFGKVQ